MKFILMHCEITAKRGGKPTYKRPRSDYNTKEIVSGKSRLRVADAKIPLEN